MTALFTGKGDDGTTYAFDCDQRFSKNSAVAETLGKLDELNSFLGLVRSKTSEKSEVRNLIFEIQQNLFIVQAQVAGAKKTIDAKKTSEMSERINDIEKILPKIKTFFVAGATEFSALLDYARTLARTAERRVVALAEMEKSEADEPKDNQVDAQTLAYMNRLSSFLYALARLDSHKSGITEDAPNYE